jgi:hypothetical protein
MISVGTNSLVRKTYNRLLNKETLIKDQQVYTRRLLNVDVLDLALLGYCTASIG